MVKGSVDRQALDTVVVDRSGRLVASPNSQYATGQDMNANDLVKSFVEQSGNTQVAVTKEYPLQMGKARVKMLGTYYAVPGLNWAVLPHNPQNNPYTPIFPP